MAVLFPSRRLPLTLFAAIFPLCPAFADDPAAPVTLEPVVVQASPFRRDPDALVQPVQVLQGAELDRKRRATLGEVLEGELGIATTDFGPGVGRPIIRGLGGTRVQILSDGLPAMDASSVSDDHAVGVDPAHAEQVEIIKGPASLIFGSGASAGIINVIDGRLAETVTPGLAAEGELSYGDNGQDRSGRGTVGYGAGSQQFHADFAARDTSRFNIPGNAAIDGQGQQGSVPNSQFRSQSGALGYSRVGAGGLVAASLSQLSSTYGLPAEETAFIDLKQTRFDAKAVALQPLPDVVSLRARFGLNVYTHTEFEGPGEPGTKFYNQEQELRLEAVHRQFGAFHGVVGLQVNHRLFDARGDEALTPRTESRQIGLFIVEQRPFQWLVPGQIELGARLESTAHQPVKTKLDPRYGGAAPSDRDALPVSVSMGTLFNLDAATHLRLGLTRSERAPTPEELYAYGPHGATGVFERGNQSLSKEKATNVEVNIDRHAGRWTWLGNVYYEQIKDFVYLVEAPADGRNADGSDSGQTVAEGQAVSTVDAEGNFVRADSGADESFVLADYRQVDARFYGAEAETRYKLLTGPVKLTGRVFGDLVRAAIEHGGDLPRITPPRYGLGLDGAKGPLSGSLTLTQVTAQRHFALDGPTASYTLLSADLAYRLPTGEGDTTLFLRGRNLLDEEARRATSFLKNINPLPGRSLYVGFNVRFD